MPATKTPASRPPRKIAICGVATHALKSAPIGNPEWEVWACSPNCDTIIRKIDRYFELHERRSVIHKHTDYVARVGVSGKPVYVFEDWPEWPNAVQYPRAAMLDKHGAEFFTSSIAWMQALAIDELLTAGLVPGDQIGLWGVHMAVDSEYATQRAGCWHFVELGRKLGIPTLVAMESDLLLYREPYPGSQQSPLHRKLIKKREEAALKVKGYEAQLGALGEMKLKTEGEIANLDWLFMILGVEKE